MEGRSVFVSREKRILGPKGRSGMNGSMKKRTGILEVGSGVTVAVMTSPVMVMGGWGVVGDLGAPMAARERKP